MNKTKAIILSSQNEIEKNHKTDADDSLIVLCCANEKVFRKNIKKVEI